MIRIHKIKNIENNDLSEYRITDDGRIYSKKTNKFLRTKINNGYESITLENKSYMIHRLLALTFIPFIKHEDKILVVDHIDANPLNNKLENLQWITQKENINRNIKQTSHPRVIYQKTIDGIIIKEYNSITEASIELNVSRSAVSKACIGKNDTCKGFIFEYKNPKYKHQEIDISLGKKINDFENYIVFGDGQIYNTLNKSYLKPIMNDSGYSYVNLSKTKTKGKNYYIHRLVAEYYIENSDKINKVQVNHKHKQRSNNHKDNLEWVSKSENMIHAHN